MYVILFPRTAPASQLSSLRMAAILCLYEGKFHNEVPQSLVIDSRPGSLL